MRLLALAVLVLAAASVLFITVLATRRVMLGRRERRRVELEDRLRPLVFALLEEGAPPHDLSADEATAFAAILSRYAQGLRGDARARIATFFEQSGGLDGAVQRLDDRRSWKRAEAAYALGDMGSSRPIPALIAALGDEDRHVRSAAARSLGRLGAVEAVEPLLDALGTVPRAVLGAALLAIGPDAVPRLLQLVAHPSPEERAGAVQLVGLLGTAAEARPLRDALLDTSAEVRAQAALALGRLGAEQAADALRETLADRVPFVRAAAAEALGLLNDPNAVEALLAQARDDEFDAARAAAEALRRIDPGRLRAEAANPARAGKHVVEAADLAAL